MKFYVLVELETIDNDWSITELQDALLLEPGQLTNQSWSFDALPVRISDSSLDFPLRRSNV